MDTFVVESFKPIVSSDIFKQCNRSDVILSDRLKRALDDYEELLRREKEAIEALIQ